MITEYQSSKIMIMEDATWAAKVKEAIRQIHVEERGECTVVHDSYGDWYCYENGEKEYVSIGD